MNNMVRVSGIFVNMNLPGIEELPFAEIRTRNNYCMKPKSIDYINYIPDEQGIYFFIDSNGIIVYIGESENIKNRLKGHNILSEYRDDIISISWLALPRGHEIERYILEKAYILYYKPRLNKEIRYNTTERI